jgi:hypothetical protein
MASLWHTVGPSDSSAEVSCGRQSRGDHVATLFHILRPEMDRSRLEVSIDNYLFTKKY